MVHKHEDGTCSISSRQVWLPGCYENEKTANYAFRFEDKTLYDLQQMANKRNGGTMGVITREDLQSS